MSKKAKSTHQRCAPGADSEKHMKFSFISIVRVLPYGRGYKGRAKDLSDLLPAPRVDSLGDAARQSCCSEARLSVLPDY